MTAEKCKTKLNRLAFFLKAIQMVTLVFISMLLVSGCGSSNSADKKLSLTIGFDEDWKVGTYCDGSGWRGMSKWTTSMQTNEDGPFNVSFCADKKFSNTLKKNDAAPTKKWALLSTNALDVLQPAEANNAAIWVRGTLQPLDTNWDYFSCDLKVSSKMPMELTFFGFQNTNNIQTNEDGTVFNFNAGDTNVSFVGKIAWVFEKKRSQFHK